MSNDNLTPFSYEILALVGRGGASAHDLRRMVQRGRIWAWAGESQYYVEPKRLARLGYLATHKEPGKTRERTVYTLTDRGLGALRTWARTPVRFPRLQHDGAVRLLAADLVGEGAVRDGLVMLRDDIAELSALLDVAEQHAHTLPHRSKYLLLNNALARRLLAAHLEWLDEVERELAGTSAPPDAETAD